MVGCFGFNGPLRQYFSLYRAVSQREGEREERIDESKNVQTIPTRTYCKRNRPLPYCYRNCRTPRHWKFTQHHRITRPPPHLSQRLKGELIVYPWSVVWLPPPFSKIFSKTTGLIKARFGIEPPLDGGTKIGWGGGVSVT